ncbi:MAG: FadR/GntR family transcriptional regulator [Sphingomonadaceae bacterium]
MARDQSRLTLRVRPPAKSTLTRQVTSLLTEEIVSRRLPPNELLPKEQDLAEQLGVSRMVIRESLRMLAAFGLVDVRHGVGVFVNPPDAWQVEEPLSLLLRAERGSLMRWLEVRALFEVGLVRLAAIRATDQQLRDLSAPLDRMRASTVPEEVVSADLDFHLAISAATGNPLFEVLMRPIMKPVREYLLAAVRLPGRRDQSIAEHEAILRALDDRDPEHAATLMERHLSIVAAEIETLHSVPDIAPGADPEPLAAQLGCL